VSIYAAMHVPEGLFAVWHNWVWAGNRLAKERQIVKKQLKRELAKETRFRPAGQAPIEQAAIAKRTQRPITRYL
jgi:hypothetical protein